MAGILLSDTYSYENKHAALYSQRLDDGSQPEEDREVCLTTDKHTHTEIPFRWMNLTTAHRITASKIPSAVRGVKTEDLVFGLIFSYWYSQNCVD